MTTAVKIREPGDKPRDVEERIIKTFRTALRQVAGTTDPANLATLIGIAFRREFPEGKGDNRVANALARGIAVRQKLLEAEGGSWSAEEAARELGISKTTILKRYRTGHIIAWREESQNTFRFPVWQFKNHKVLDGLEEVLKALNSGSRLDDIGRILFFHTTRGFLGRKTPLDCLRAGNIAKAFLAAEGYSERSKR